MIKIKRKLLLFCTLSVLTVSNLGAQQLPVTNYWIGNTHPNGGTFSGRSAGGQPARWGLNQVDDICVASDGTVYTNVFWEEGGANVSEIKNGSVLGSARGTIGWGHRGGESVTNNSKYIYFGQKYSHIAGRETVRGNSNLPPEGKVWYGVSRRLRSDIKKGIAFPGGKGGHASPVGCFKVVTESTTEQGAYNVSGLYATDSELFVASFRFNTIYVYNAETMAFKRRLQIPKPESLAMDKQNHLWVVTDDGTKIRRYNASTGEELTGQRIDGLSKSGIMPTDICIDGNNRLLVADYGASNQIRIYTNINKAPANTSNFGVRGGVLAGPRKGKIGPKRFFRITGVGVDSSNNIYVASSQEPMGHGAAIIEKYNSNGTRAWDIKGILFVDACGIDPVVIGDNPLNMIVMGEAESMVMDLSKAPGANHWHYRSMTCDPNTYPHDPRVVGFNRAHTATSMVRRFNGGRFVYMGPQRGNQFVTVYRSSKEQLIPCVIYSREPTGTWPGEPTSGAWIWHDNDLDGQMEAGEYQSGDGVGGSAGHGWYVDSAGDIFLATGDAIRKFPKVKMQGGFPRYSFSSAVTWNKPAFFKKVRRVRYDRATDRMYLGGTTGTTPGVDRNIHWKPMGPYLARYDNWKTTKNQRWTRKLTIDPDSAKGGHETCEPMSFDIAGDYAFVGLVGASKALNIPRQRIEVYRLSNGTKVGHIDPPAHFGTVGILDIVESLQAAKRGKDYVIVMEEVRCAKNLVYKWRP